MLHELPGFHNQCVLSGVIFSPLSSPFVMYLNFDKTMVGVILCLMSDHWQKEPLLNLGLVKRTICVLLLCVVVILGPAIATGYIKIDPKIPSELWLWGVNNLFFVCFAEETVFRGCLQRGLSQQWANKTWGVFGSIVLSSIIFGLFHIKSGGVVYVALAAICGLFYGYVYHRTQSIRCSMLVHFGLNLCHFLLFTYPSAARLG